MSDDKKPGADEDSTNADDPGDIIDIEFVDEGEALSSQSDSTEVPEASEASPDLNLAPQAAVSKPSSSDTGRASMAVADRLERLLESLPEDPIEEQIEEPVEELGKETVSPADSGEGSASNPEQTEDPHREPDGTDSKKARKSKKITPIAGAKRPLARARPIRKQVIKARPKRSSTDELSEPAAPDQTPKEIAEGNLQSAPLSETGAAPVSTHPSERVEGPTLRTAAGDSIRTLPRRPAKTLQEMMTQALKAHEGGNLEEAAQLYSDLLSVAPDHAGAWINLGVLNRRAGRYQTAVTCLKRGVRLKPEDGAAWSNLGNALRAVNRLEDSLTAHEQALELSPDQASVHYNASLALRDTGDLDGALQAMRRAELLGYSGSDLAWDRALTVLVSGDLEEGFKDYESRWAQFDSSARHQNLPLWDGTSLGEKTLLVWAEQGLGDTLHFSRYLANGAPGVQSEQGRILFEVQPALTRLFNTSPLFEGIEVVSRTTTPPQADLQVPLLSLPRLLGTTLETLPNSCPYITAPAQPSPISRQADTERMKVGLCWAGKPSHRNDRNRSMALSRFQPLLDLPGIDFFSLQKGAAAEEISDLALGPLVRDLGRGFRELDDAAAAIRDLDLVITVDTAIAHLAGAMNKPVWVLVPYAPDWRWMLQRNDSPWYPSMTLFRQSSPGDWDETLERLRRALVRRFKSFEAETTPQPE